MHPHAHAHTHIYTQSARQRLACCSTASRRSQTHHGPEALRGGAAQHSAAPASAAHEGRQVWRRKRRGELISARHAQLLRRRWRIQVEPACACMCVCARACVFVRARARAHTRGRGQAAKTHVPVMRLHARHADACSPCQRQQPHAGGRQSKHPLHRSTHTHTHSTRTHTAHAHTRARTHTHTRTKRAPVWPASARAAYTASLSAKKTAAPRWKGGSPTAWVCVVGVCAGVRVGVCACRRVPGALGVEAWQHATVSSTCACVHEPQHPPPPPETPTTRAPVSQTLEECTARGLGVFCRSFTRKSTGMSLAVGIL
jgi:hypothetical protein